ncbi:MAG: hypothetical protein APF78_02620 [Sphingomonadales bacterium BRH_c3]|nr:MAG: hypothetical protein APF78_02620 [Sphingomonadales bacterium BRH_c3]
MALETFFEGFEWLTRISSMTVLRILRSHFAILLVAALSLPVDASAHDGHKKDMSDAEMAQMEMHGDADMHGAPSAARDHLASGKTEPAATTAATPVTAEQALEAKIAENRITSAGDLLGRLHPVAAHFPIALLLMAAIAEILLFMRPAWGLEITVRFLVSGGAAGAAAAAVFGWFAGGWRLEDRSETLALHRWNGTAIAAVAIMAAWLAFRPGSRKALRFVIALLAVALVIQGYHGGEMVFGPNHLGLE